MLVITNAHLQFGTCCICSINEKLMYAFEVLLLQLKLFKGFLQDKIYPVHSTVSEGCPPLYNCTGWKSFCYLFFSK